MANLRGLLGAIADLPGVINQGLLGPLPLNPQFEEMIGQGQAQAYRQQASNDFAMSLLAGGRAPGTLPAASQAAQQGFSGRVFDAFKQQEMVRLNKAQQDELARQQRLAQDPSYANLSPQAQEGIVAEGLKPISPEVQRKHDLEMSMLQKRFDYDMKLQQQRDAVDLRIQAMKGSQDQGLSQQQQIKNLQALRKEYRGLQSVKDYETVLPLVASAKKAPNTGYGDLQLIYTVGKALDPNSVVREGELQLTLSAADPVSKAIGQAQFVVQKGGRLTPKLRKDLVEMLEQRTSSYRDAYKRDYQQFSQYAREQGYEAAAVVGTRAESAYGGEVSSGSGGTSYASEAEAEAAAARGELKPGTRVTIGGVPGTWQ